MNEIEGERNSQTWTFTSKGQDAEEYNAAAHACCYENRKSKTVLVLLIMID